MKRSRFTKLLVPVVCVVLFTAWGGSAASAAANGTDRPWKASGSATATITPGTATTPTTIDNVGVAQAAHLGRITAHQFLTCSPTGCANGTSTTTYVAANGDIVTVSGVIVAGVNTNTITGGTGRFAGATGSFTVASTNFMPDPSNPLKLTFDFTHSGMISY